MYYEILLCRVRMNISWLILQGFDEVRFHLYYVIGWSWDSSVGIETRLWIERQRNWGPISFVTKDSSLQRPGRVWGPHSFVSSGYLGLFLWVKATGA
jgi:hypothetical protein